MSIHVIRLRPSLSVRSRTSTAAAPTAILPSTGPITRRATSFYASTGGRTNMRKHNYFAVLAVFAVLLLPSEVIAQDKTEKAEKTEDHGSIDFGLRYAWGDVYGRTD